MTLVDPGVISTRRLTRPVTLGTIQVGDGAPVSVQSMTNTDTSDTEGTLEQIRELSQAGCDIVRISVPDARSLESFVRIRERVPIPLIADIHYDHTLAVGALRGGADGVRINPGNIGSVSRLGEIVSAAADNGAAIRIGVNAGSLERDILKAHGHPGPKALVESCIRWVQRIEEMGFYNFKLSVKASDPLETVIAYRMLSEAVDYPLHVGVTEAGTPLSGSVRTATALALLFEDGIGDTIRFSLSGDPVPEIHAAHEFLKALGMRGGPRVVACPTCARAEVDVASLALEVERRVADIAAPLRIAVMGCPVNGPGEAREADAGIAGGKDSVILFVRGQVKARLKEHEALDTLMEEVELLAAEYEG